MSDTDKTYPGGIRLIVCFDFDETTLKDAYRALCKNLQGVTVAWETSDEWYPLDTEDGGAGSEDELGTAICDVFKEDDGHRGN